MSVDELDDLHREKIKELGHLRQQMRRRVKEEMELDPCEVFKVEDGHWLEREKYGCTMPEIQDEKPAQTEPKRENLIPDRKCLRDKSCQAT